MCAGGRDWRRGAWNHWRQRLPAAPGKTSLFPAAEQAQHGTMSGTGFLAKGWKREMSNKQGHTKTGAGKERIYCGMANVRLYEEKLLCSQHCSGPQTHWWDALSVTPASPPPPPDSPSLQRSDGCGWVQGVTQCLPRAVESSLLPFILDLVAAGNEKPVWLLDFQKGSVLLGTEQKSATNITEGDAENWEYLNLVQGCCYWWLSAAWRGRMVEGMVEERLGHQDMLKLGLAVISFAIPVPPLHFRAPWLICPDFVHLYKQYKWFWIAGDMAQGRCPGTFGGCPICMVPFLLSC